MKHMSCLKILDYFERREEIEELRPRVYSFLESVYEKDKGYYQTVKADKPSMHALHSALGIMNIYHNLTRRNQYD